MWRYVRSLAVVGLLCLLAGHRLGPGIAQAQAVPAARSAPDEVLAALPEGATAIAAVAADLMGNGEQQWVVRYTLEPGGFFGDANAAIIAAESDGWAVVHTMTIEGGNLGGMTLLDVDGITAVLLEALIGAHAELRPGGPGWRQRAGGPPQLVALL